MQDLNSEGLERGFQSIRQYADSLSLSPETKDTAQVIHRRAMTSPDVSLVGRGIEIIAASALHIACRQIGEVRTANEIANVSNDTVEAKQIHRTTKYLCSQLDLGLVVADPADFVDRIGAALNAPDDHIELVKYLITVLKEDGIALNQAANTVAATVFYFVGAYDREHGQYTQVEIGNIADVSPLTIRNNYHDYTEILTEDNINDFYTD